MLHPRAHLRRSPVARCFALAALILALAATAHAADSTTAPKTRAKGKKAEAKAQQASEAVYAAGNPSLPNVLVIGDSISIGYTPFVQKALAGKANVYHNPGNGSDTQNGLNKLDMWLDGMKWSVIHFQFGLHDLKYLDPAGKYDVQNGKQVASPEQYAKNLTELVARLKKTGAKLIFATTTPVPEASSGRVGGDEAKYNEAALKVMKDAGVEVDDLCGLVKPRIAEYQLPKNVHFTPLGYTALANQAAGEIAKALGTTASKLPDPTPTPVAKKKTTKAKTKKAKKKE